MMIHPKLFTGLLCWMLIGTLQLSAQQTIVTQLQKEVGAAQSAFLGTTYVNHGRLYHDRIELLELASGESGYVEFSFNYFDQSDISIGLRHSTDATQSWTLRFLNGQAMIDANVLGAATNGTVYRIERCETSVRYWADDQLLSESPLADFNFSALAFVQVDATLAQSGNNPSLNLQFPFVAPCAAPPPGTNNAKVYADLKKDLDGTFVQLTSPVLRFKYEEDYATAVGQNDVLDWIIYDWDQAPPASPNQSGTLNKRMGLNYFSINLSVDINRHYTLEVEDSRGQKQYLRLYYYCPPGQNCITLDGGGLQAPNPAPTLQEVGEE
ncbi:MAG: hypothetical protein AAF146_07615 [Bacteroidota bacterium]